MGSIGYARPVRRGGGPVLIAAVAFAYTVAFPLVIGLSDESHLLHGARRLYEGQVLYRDFFEIIPPLGFYFIAAAYWIGGTTLLTARVATAAVEALGCAALFMVVRQLAGVLEGVLAALLLAALCIPVWPYASAHWMTTTLGLVTADVVLAERWAGSHRLRPAMAGLLAGTAVCVQQQRGVFVLAWVLTALPGLGLASPAGQRRTLTELAWAATAAGAVIAIVLGHAAWVASPQAVIEHLYGFAVESYGPQHRGVIGWAGTFPLTEPLRAATWVWLLRIAPLLLVAEAVVLARRARRPWSRTLLARAAAWWLAVLMALSVAYLPDFIHVSFVMPFIAISALCLLRDAGTWVAQRLPAGRAVVTGMLAAAAIAIAVKGARTLAGAEAGSPLRVQTGFGILRGNEFFERVLNGVRRNLVPEPTGRSLVYAYPNDAWLYLTLPADDAARLDILTPAFPQRYLDQVTEMLRAQRPGTVVLMSLGKPNPTIIDAVTAGYDLAEEVYPFRIYVRRGRSRPPA